MVWNLDPLQKKYHYPTKAKTKQQLGEMLCIQLSQHEI